MTLVLKNIGLEQLTHHYLDSYQEDDITMFLIQ